MNTKTITLTIAFAALAIALNVIKIPTFYLPGFNYRVYEIPIVVSFLLFGPKIGILVTILNALGQLFIIPAPAGIVTVWFGILAIFIMMAGVYLANRLLKGRFFAGNKFRASKIVGYLTVSGAVFRGVAMPILDFFLLYHILLPLYLGRPFMESYMVGLIPGLIAFNATVPLYTIPISYLVAKRVNKILEPSSSLKGILT